jgi:hypothetical protein
MKTSIGPVFLFALLALSCQAFGGPAGLTESQQLAAEYGKAKKALETQGAAADKIAAAKNAIAVITGKMEPFGKYDPPVTMTGSGIQFNVKFSPGETMEKKPLDPALRGTPRHQVLLEMGYPVVRRLSAEDDHEHGFGRFGGYGKDRNADARTDARKRHHRGPHGLLPLGIGQRETQP